MLPNLAQLYAISQLAEGDVQQVPFAVLLHALAIHEKSAQLEMERRQVRKTVVLEDGVPVDCRSNLVHETLGPYLVSTGKLREEDFRSTFAESVARGVRLGHVLLEKELITPVELFKALQQNLAKKLLDLFTWKEGTFRVGPPAQEHGSSLKVKVPQLVVMGITKFAAQDDADGGIGPMVGKSLAIHPWAPIPLEEIKLSARHEKVLPPLREGRRLDELATQTGLPFDEITRLLYALALLGVVVPADEVPEEARVAAREVAQVKATPAPPVTAVAAPVAEAPEPEAGMDPALVDRIANEVMQSYLSYREKDPLDLFSLPEDTTLPTVQERFLGWTRRFGPDRFDAPELTSLAEKARELFLAGAAAYGELADPERRQLVMSRRRAKRETAATRKAPDFTLKTDLLDPEVQYRKIVPLLQAGRWREAITQLEFVADCDPGNGLYRADLAWCRYRINPGGAVRGVIKELDEALRIDPKCGLAAFYAGEICAAIHDLDAAEAYYRRALKLMAPDRRPVEALKNLRTKK